MQKYWKVYNGYHGMDAEEYKSLEDAQAAAKILANDSKNNRKYPTTILEAIGQVKVPVPELEIEMFV